MSSVVVSFFTSPLRVICVRCFAEDENQQKEMCVRCDKHPRYDVRAICRHCFAADQRERRAKPEFVCPSCNLPNVKHRNRTICTKCVSKEGNERTKARKARTEGLGKAMQQHEDNKSAPFPQREKLGNSTDWLSRPLMGVRV